MTMLSGRSWSSLICWYIRNCMCVCVCVGRRRGGGGCDCESFCNTVFARSDAAATIYFITQFCAASIREQLLIESGVY